MTTDQPALTELANALRVQDYVDRKQVIRDSSNHQRTTLALALGAFGALVGLLLDRQTRSDPIRLFVLLGLAELAVLLAAYLTIGSAQTIDHAAGYVAEIEETCNFRGWERGLREGPADLDQAGRLRRAWRRWPSHFSGHLAVLYAILAAIPLYLRLELGRQLTTPQAIILWVLEVLALFACLWLLLRRRASVSEVVGCGLMRS